MTSGQPTEKSIFMQAVEMASADEREAFLREACGENAQLLAEIQALLRAHQTPQRLLDEPAAGFPTLEQPPMERPGTVIGPYKLLQQIGEGGMGTVYMAEQTEPVERRVALKIIKPGMDSRQVIARFEAERQALAMMDHPNIARVLDAGTTDTGRPYFVMELVKGTPITEYCDEHHLTPRQRLELFIPVCQAVQHAHQKGIIHRDIKPSNILVAEYDDRPVPKVIDFGVAKAIEHRLTQKTMFTHLGQVVGTIDYMSPEQAKLNQLDIDTRSDIYSLGVVLYELLTGETPLDRQRLHSAAFDEMLRIIREEEPPRPSVKLSSSHSLPSIAAQRHTEPRKLSTLVRGELDWIVMKALEKDRTRRYETANGLAHDIERYLADEPVLACPPSAAYRFTKFARRNKAALFTAGLVAAVLLIGIIVSTWQAIRANRAATAERLAHEEADQAREAEAQQRTLAEQQRDLAEKNFGLANAEQHRAEGNLNLAMKALDAVYLDAIGKDKLLGEPVAKRSESESVPPGPPPLSALERELLKRGLAFYDQFAQQNAAAPRAFVQTAQAQYRVGLIHAGLGDGARATEAFREAIRRFERLTKEEPTSAEHFRQLADAYRGLANALPDWDAAKKILDSGRVAYSKAIELRPGDATLYLDRGDVLNAVSGSRDIADYQRALQLDPDNVGVLLKCCNYYHCGHNSIQDPRKARECGERAVALAPDNPQCHIALARVLGQVAQGVPGPRVNAAAALQHFERAIQLAPNSAEAHFERGQFYYYVADNDRALVDLNRALELDPHHYLAMKCRARVFGQLGQYDKALAELATVAKYAPHKATLHSDIANMHVRKKDWPAAAEAFTKALQIAPFNWHILGGRAMAYVHLGRYDQALADLRKSLEVDPNSGVLLWISKTQLERSPETFRQGLLELARQAIERSRVPANASAIRARLHERMNDLEKAEAEFAKAIDRGGG